MSGLLIKCMNKPKTYDLVSGNEQRGWFTAFFN